MIQPLWWQDQALHVIDQRLLPTRYEVHVFTHPEDVATAIETLCVRGAPAIGIAAAYGLALAGQTALKTHNPKTFKDLEPTLKTWTQRLARTRPTAVNLFWALDRMSSVLGEQVSQGVAAAAGVARLCDEAQRIHQEDIQACQRMGDYGARLIQSGARLLTHCNAGALATGGWGTALGVVRSAVASGKQLHVYADETRPFLQGSRLTMWELMQDKIPCTLLTDSMAGYLMLTGQIDGVIVGADRIAANGDVANKIGTYSLAVLARQHGLPFYVAAPKSTFDIKAASLRDIPIEERSSREVTQLAGQTIAPAGALARHPAFDLTPHHLITAIITEEGVLEAPFAPAIRQLCGSPS